MRNTLAIIFVATTLFGTSAWADVIYKCKNPGGGMLYQNSPCAKDGQAILSWTSRPVPKGEENTGPPSSPDGILIIGLGRNGGYFVDGAVNNQYLNFVIDTGATLVTLPQDVAASAGIYCQKNVVVQTGNGTTIACTATIQELKFGVFTIKNVDAMIAPNLNQPLLGMNVLKRFRVEQDNGEMHISKKY